MASWRDMAIGRIAACLLEYEMQCACLSEQMTAKEARKYCNDRYPFTMRQYTPYKIWLEELRLVKTFIDSKRPAITYQTWRGQITSKGYRSPRKNHSSEGQMNLLNLA